MDLFKKEDNVLTRAEKIFLDEFPTWSIQHATKLIEEVKNDPNNDWSEILKDSVEAEGILIDCLTGAHAVNLKFSSPEGVLLIFGGMEKISNSLSLWAQRAQNFTTLAIHFIEHSMEKNKGGKDPLTESIEKVYQSDKPLEPISAHLAMMADKFVADELKKSGSPFLVAGLYGTMFQLQQEQGNWISNNVLEKAQQG